MPQEVLCWRGDLKKTGSFHVLQNKTISCFAAAAVSDDDRRVEEMIGVWGDWLAVRLCAGSVLSECSLPTIDIPRSPFIVRATDWLVDKCYR